MDPPSPGDVEQLATARVAEDGTEPARQNRRHPPPPLGQVPVADGEDATVDAMEPAGGHALGYRSLAQP
jgi:hypothetical protein